MAEARNVDRRASQMAILFWGLLSEQVGQGMMERLGIHALNVDQAFRQGLLDSHPEYVQEFLRLYCDSEIKSQVQKFVRDVVAMAEQAAKNVDAKGGAS